MKPKDLVGIPWRVAFALQADGWYLRSDIIWHKPNPMPESVRDRPTKAHEYVFLLSKSARYYYDAKAIAEDLESGPSDIKKMLEQRDRSGGKHLEADDPLLSASGATQVGRKRAVLPRVRSGNKKRDIPCDDDGRGIPNDHLGRSVPWEAPEDWKRNARTVWTIATQPYAGAHFATFPEELARRCILAGSAPGDVVLDPFAGSGTVGQVATGNGRGAVLVELNPALCRAGPQPHRVAVGGGEGRMTLEEFKEREKRWILAGGQETFSELDEAEAERERIRRENEYYEWFRNQMR